MAEKLYFKHDDEGCYTLNHHQEYMKDNFIDEMILFEAKRETGMGYFYCREYGEIGEVGEGCGKLCDGYKPNNGKNGRCKHYGWCYEQTENKFILKAGQKKLLKVENKYSIRSTNV